ncbi:unnamed protein product [Arabis nemorensis]|uniref:F-box domain-containing protein n=1 Tax=Arabis nemorensis TaxID=586526 RepID=A0A565BL17_9BRAS|nr:unnamed protein product [Arabis nemorensis]
MVVETRRQYGKKVIAAKWNDIESAENVSIDILSRLSVRDIRSLKTVSHRSISTKYFAQQQITHSRKKPSYISCPGMDKTMDLFLLRPGSLKLMNLTSLNPPEKGDNGDLYMISSFNGLICCIYRIYDKTVGSKFRDLQIWICNPSTGETLPLPQGTPSFGVEPSVGVAYGSDISDYRVFRIFCVSKKVSEAMESMNVRCICPLQVLGRTSGPCLVFQCEQIYLLTILAMYLLDKRQWWGGAVEGT